MSSHICFIAPAAYPLLTGCSGAYVIGPAVHTVLLAKELIKHNFEITFITYGGGGTGLEYVNGIRVIKTYPEGSHLNLALKALRIWTAMKKANAYIYFHQGGSAGIVSLQ